MTQQQIRSLQEYERELEDQANQELKEYCDNIANQMNCILKKIDDEHKQSLKTASDAAKQEIADMETQLNQMLKIEDNTHVDNYASQMKARLEQSYHEERDKLLAEINAQIQQRVEQKQRETNEAIETIKQNQSELITKYKNKRSVITTNYNEEYIDLCDELENIELQIQLFKEIQRRKQILDDLEKNKK